MTTEQEKLYGYIRWLERRLYPDPFVLITVDELIKIADETPPFFIDDLDYEYRDGFEDGFDYCIECFETMYCKKGFVRIREIANVLWSWSESALRPWRYWGKGKHKNDGCLYPHPIHIHETWNQIRQRIIRRDGACTICGSASKLEVDHIEEVQDGGLPIDSNLRVLCQRCHKSKAFQ